jgi:hypothetical protein
MGFEFKGNDNDETSVELSREHPNQDKEQEVIYVSLSRRDVFDKKLHVV